MLCAFVEGAGATSECLLLPVSGASQELRHVVCILLRPGARRLSFRLLLPVHIHAAAELSRQPRDESASILSARTTHLYRRQYCPLLVYQGDRSSWKVMENHC